MPSYGPDFLATSECLYCKICEHILWPVCNDQNEVDCFDIAEIKIRFAFYTLHIKDRDQIQRNLSQYHIENSREELNRNICA